MASLRPAITLLAVFTLLCGLLYPALVTALARNAPGDHALVGQRFTEPSYFWSRPSAVGYDARTSSGTNLGPSNLRELMSTRLETLRAADPGNRAPIPVDLVTASASGLDPHISPAAAYYQVARVARARGVPEPRVRELVAGHIEGRTFGILGERRVNVVRLNRALDAATGSMAKR
jgi:K+-transporting ATPase ATPase C chain